MLLNVLSAFGHRGIKTISTFSRAGLIMLFNALVGKPELREHMSLLMHQLYNVGVLSMLRELGPVNRGAIALYWSRRVCTDGRN